MRLLELNGRAHRSPEIGRAYEQARALGFPQINIDLIAGMLGESDENWQRCIARTIELAPDSVTIYPMELPFNTTISADILKHTGQFSQQVATWDTRRRWVREAFDALDDAGYTIGSAYTAVKDPARTRFLYRDRLWEGADLVGLGVASFGHINGVHVQNADTWEAYGAAIDRGELPLGRAYRPIGRRAPDPRGHSPAQARIDSAGLLRREVRRGCPRALRGRLEVAGRRRIPGAPRRRLGRRGRRRRPDLPPARGPARASTRCSSASSCPTTGESGIRDTGIGVRISKS